MMGKTHIYTGIASSLVLLHPATIPGILGAAAGGAAGGWICDIDCRSSKINHWVAIGAFLVVVAAVGAIILDWNGIYLYLRRHDGLQAMVGLLLLLGCCVYGITTSHRGFTHSLFALALMSVSVALCYKPLALPFMVGFASHLILDLTNKKGLQLFFPFKKRFCLGLCTSDGKCNDFLMHLAALVSVLAAAVLVVRVIAAYL